MTAPQFKYGAASYLVTDCLGWMAEQDDHSVHGVVTDPPYGLIEYTKKENGKRLAGKGGVWRIPPSFDGHQRSPLPRFSILTQRDLENLFEFFNAWAVRLRPVLVPGAHVLVASNPLVSTMLSAAIQTAGYERRGEIIRLVQTMRGGDRPKNAHEEFSGVSVMPKSQYEPWVLFRKPIEGRVQDNLRRWKTGGLRRISDAQPFGDVIRSAPTRKKERELAPHPSLKPQGFLRQVVRAILPLGEGVVLDPFAGSGSTLAAAEAVGYASIGLEKDPDYLDVARRGIPALANLDPAKRPGLSSTGEDLPIAV
jgi:DNA modification methylase